MALESVGGIIEVPPSIETSQATSNALLDAEDEKYAFVLQIPKAGNISKVVFRTGTVTKATNGMTIGIQTTSAGDPTGSAYKSMVAITGQAVVSNTLYEVSLGTAAGSVVQGDVVAVVIEFTTWDAGNSMNVTILTGMNADPGFAYNSVYTGTWSRGSTKIPVVALGYDDGSYEAIGGVLPGIASWNVDTGTDPDEIALRFQVPFGCRAIGAWLVADIDASDDFDVVLYEDDDSVLQTLSVDASAIGQAVTSVHHLTFATSQEISADTWYRLTLKPTTANTINLEGCEVPSAAVMGALGLGTNAYASTRVNAGGWTSVATKRPYIGLRIDQIETGGGATLAPNIGFPFARQR